jgi:hypothetical protein
VKKGTMENFNFRRTVPGDPASRFQVLVGPCRPEIAVGNRVDDEGQRSRSRSGWMGGAGAASSCRRSQLQKSADGIA